MSQRIDRLIQKYGEPCMWAAGAAALVGILLHHFSPVPQYALWFVLAATVLCGVPILKSAMASLRYKTVGIELLVTFAVIGALCIGEFSEAAIVTFLFRFGSYLEQKTLKKTRSAIRQLTEMAPSSAWRYEGDAVTEVDIDEVEIGDLLLVKTGGRIPTDGIVRRGEGYAAEAAITGEPEPRHVQVGDTVYGGTILESGALDLEATRVGEDTAFGRIIALVEEAQDAKSPAERFIDRFARYYTPAVVVLAALVLLVTRSVDTAITVLVLACPGALVIGAPIANVAGIGRGAREGILLKGGDSVHTFAKTDCVAFDKTGTLTEGRPEVVSHSCAEDLERWLSLTAAAEQASDHPLGKAVLRYAEGRGVPVSGADRVETIPGRGLVAEVQGRTILIGSPRFMEEQGVDVGFPIRGDLKKTMETGCSVVVTASEGKARLALFIRDRVKPGAREELARLRKLGIRELVILTGDHPAASRAVCEELCADEVRWELLPEQKLSVVRELQNKGYTVTFVGDGINDSPAITAADTGIAMGSGTEIAMDCSDVVLIRSDLHSMGNALALSKKIRLVMYENIAIAIGTVALLLAGLFMGYIHMAAGMLIHEASILLVIFNAMRLLIGGNEK